MKPLKLVFAGRSVTIFDYDKNYNPNSMDDYVAVTCRYIDYQMAFLTPAGNKIKVWNALTGEVKKIFSDVCENEITAFNLDNLMKRILLGDSGGIVLLLNVANGAKIKSLPEH